MLFWKEKLGLWIDFIIGYEMSRVLSIHFIALISNFEIETDKNLYDLDANEILKKITNTSWTVSQSVVDADLTAAHPFLFIVFKFCHFD